MLLGTKGAVVVLRHAPETIARRTSFEESLRFERVHEEIYRNFGFEFVPIVPGSLSDRVDAITCSAPAYNLRS
jgi:predicted ATPase